MKINDPKLTAEQLAADCGGQLIGNGQLRITGANEIHHVEKGDICFVDFHKYYKPTLASAASVILIDQATECPPDKALIVVKEPFFVYNELVKRYKGGREYPIATSLAKIGQNTIIEAGAHISGSAVIGDNCHIYAGAFIGDDTLIGNGVVVHAGAVIGSEAFYFKNTPNGRIPWKSGGRVVLEDRVEIGPNCNIAKGVSSDTRIGEGSKLDALIQIGHDCKIGKNCLFAAQVGVAGNVTIGDNCIFYGQVGIAQNIRIANEVAVLAQSGVGEDLEAGKTYFGSPCVEKRQAYRELLTLRQLSK